MFSRFDRNLLRKAASVLALAMLVTLTLGLADAQAATPRGVQFVDGSGMAATDNTEDPRQSGGGGSMEGDPWGGEQRDAGTTLDGPTIAVETHHTSDAVRAAWSMTGFWSRLLAFLTSFVR